MYPPIIATGFEYSTGLSVVVDCVVISEEPGVVSVTGLLFPPFGVVDFLYSTGSIRVDWVVSSLMILA